MSNYKLIDFLVEFTDALQEQLEADEIRWGDTWKHRPRKGQEDRAFARYRDYYDQYKRGGQSIPWLKVTGEAFIAWVRENHPDELISEEV